VRTEWLRCSQSADSESEHTSQPRQHVTRSVHENYEVCVKETVVKETVCGWCVQDSYGQGVRLW